jgi:hypothetical protein
MRPGDRAVQSSLRRPKLSINAPPETMPIVCDSSSSGPKSASHEEFTVEMLTDAVRRLAQSADEMRPDEIASSLAAACQQWRQRSFASRRVLVAEIAEAWKFSPVLLQESLDALLAPFAPETVAALGRGAKPYRKPVGFIMPGNVPGAGLHDVVMTLTRGAPVIIKTASTEPFFFKRFVETLTQIDPRLSSRIAVFNWPRHCLDLTAALLRYCSPVVVLGHDETVAKLRAYSASMTVGFGARVSGVILAREALAQSAAELASAVARDASLFEQRGCLSPHHIFVEDEAGSRRSRDFAAHLAEQLQQFAERFPPPSSLTLEEAAALRRIREIARWRELAGHDVKMWEGRSLSWSVVYDDLASFQLSPAYRTLFVSPFVSAEDLSHRLSPVGGRLEALGLSDPAGRLTDLITKLRSAGLSYVCAPGLMQSPPIDWPHGGGALLEFLKRAAEIE